MSGKDLKYGDNNKFTQFLRLLFVIPLFFISISSFAGEKDSLKRDTIPFHSIKKAVIFSAFAPGTGQFYNYKWTPTGTKGRNNVFWKVPLYYAAIGATGYFLVQNQMIQSSLKKEHNDRANNVPASDLNPDWATYDSLGILSLYDIYSTRRDLSILAFGAAYLFQVVEAGIGAHFVKFDISDDLTMHVHPVLLNNQTAGLGLSFNFR